MALPNYPEIKDVDELFGFSAARKRALEAEGQDLLYEEPAFIQHRIFMNQVDSFNAKCISSYIADQIYGAQKAGGGGDEGEEGEEEGEHEEKSPKATKGPEFRYEIIGTLHKSFHKKTEDILFTISEDAEDFVENVMKCGFVIYDITKDSEEIPKALLTLAAMENEIEKMKEPGPKTFKNIPETRVFILISNIMTWALTKPIDPEEAETPFTEADYRKRKAHPNYKGHIECEREVVLKGRVNKEKLRTFVVASGIIYGLDEDDLTFLFKLAWYNEKELPIFAPKKNFVPLIHINDLAKVLHGIMEKVPKKQYMLAIEQTPATFKQVMKALSKTMGSGQTKEVSQEEAYLYKEMTQSLYDRFTVSLTMEPGAIVEDLEVEWQNEMNLVENMPSIVSEFRRTRELKPLRVVLHGPPAAGKTRIAMRLVDHYGVHYANVKMLIDKALADLREKIENEKAKILAREEKEKAAEEAEGAEDEPEEEAEEEEEVDVEELQEQIREMESAMAESENGKLPDDQVNRLMKAFMSSNPCQNQGYVIDGYPKTIEQTKELFGGGGGGGEEGEEEGEGEEGEGGGGGIKILPDYVVSLQASDQFLCNRIMALPERELQGTHYMEEPMLRRLAEFRANNNEDNTMLNYFNEMEIHPIVLDVTEDDMEGIMGVLLGRFGKPIRFAISPEEEEELIRLEEERHKLLLREAQMTKELLEQQAVEDYQTKMEQWTELFEQLQLEEEKILVAQGEPLRHYMIKFVFPVLCKGLLEVARVKPDDPVDFLAEYLFRENPEGHMFDPAYTREGKRLMDNYRANAEMEVLRRAVQDRLSKCQ